MKRNVPTIILAGLVLFVIAVLWSAAVWAHGDAEWIMNERRYVDAEGLHCCGPADCYPVDADTIEVNSRSVTHGGQSLPTSRAGVYWSIDQRGWVCVRGGVLRCAFPPRGGS